jgi:hypothetical protein
MQRTIAFHLIEKIEFVTIILGVQSYDIVLSMHVPG